MPLKPPTFDNNEDSGLGALVGYMLAQQKGQGLQQQLGAGAIPVEGTDPGTGAKFENPENKAKVKQAEIEGQRVAETAPSRAVMKGTLIKAKQLTDTVPPAPVGIQKFIHGAKTSFAGATGEIPQIQEFHNMVDSSLTSFARTMYAEKGNVANWDIARVKKAFSDIVWDTEDQRSLGWNRAVDTYNDVIGSYKTLQNEMIDKRELLAPKEIGRARLLYGITDLSDLSDDELIGAVEGDIKPIPKTAREAALAELKKRGLA